MFVPGYQLPCMGSAHLCCHMSIRDMWATACDGLDWLHCLGTLAPHPLFKPLLFFSNFSLFLSISGISLLELHLLFLASSSWCWGPSHPFKVIGSYLSSCFLSSLVVCASPGILSFLLGCLLVVHGCLVC